MERIAVTANYEAMQEGKLLVARVEFVARVACAAKGYDLSTRAQRAVVRRLRVRPADVKIVGIQSS